MKLTLNPEYQLYEKGGKPFCDSLQVAESFDKSHDNVLRDIRNVISDAGDDFNLLNFEEIKYKDLTFAPRKPSKNHARKQ